MLIIIYEAAIESDTYIKLFVRPRYISNIPGQVFGGVAYFSAYLLGYAHI